MIFSHLSHRIYTNSAILEDVFVQMILEFLLLKVNVMSSVMGFMLGIAK